MRERKWPLGQNCGQAARKDVAQVVKVDVDANRGLATRFGAQSIPLLVVIRDGQEIDRVVGAIPRAALEQRLRPVLAA